MCIILACNIDEHVYTTFLFLEEYASTLNVFYYSVQKSKKLVKSKVSWVSAMRQLSVQTLHTLLVRKREKD